MSFKPLTPNTLSPFPPIKWVGFDVDGVMTDGGIMIDDNGVETKRFHSRDGHALKMLVRSGMKVAIVTGRRSQVVERRAKELGITEVHQKVMDKGEAYLKILEAHGLTPEETAFAGDDIVDLPIMIRCGLPMAPSDATSEALAVARFVSRAKGGHGAVREMVEHLLVGLGLWDAIIAKYSA
ncbi:MAG: HAD hydrolase family protein [Deltaproteobacteria bacterium]|jgi:3-deoxy-D-manno-octulosonate 8-phosphate phosphatase (KDO 8-P phosphatase)|nr:HAD hydrolase family protein [Deltaproteobacteria bacterium]